jgi:hypothetical protein
MLSELRRLLTISGTSPAHKKPVSFMPVNINDVIKSALFMVSAQYENHGVVIETNLDEILE